MYSGQIHRDRKRNGDCQELGKEKGDLFNGNGISVLPYEKSSGVW